MAGFTEAGHDAARTIAVLLVEGDSDRSNVRLYLVFGRIVAMIADGLAVYHRRDPRFNSWVSQFLTSQITALSSRLLVCNGHGMRDERPPPPPPSGWLSLGMWWVGWLVLSQPQNDPPPPPSKSLFGNHCLVFP